MARFRDEVMAAHGASNHGDGHVDLVFSNAGIGGGGSLVANSMIAFGLPEKASMEAGQGFHDTAPLSAAGAADGILDGVRSGAWRILVGEDAHALDQYVRAYPEGAYDYEKMAAALRGTPAEYLASWAADSAARSLG